MNRGEYDKRLHTWEDNPITDFESAVTFPQVANISYTHGKVTVNIATHVGQSIYDNSNGELLYQQKYSTNNDIIATPVIYTMCHTANSGPTQWFSQYPENSFTPQDHNQLYILGDGMREDTYGIARRLTTETMAYFYDYLNTEQPNTAALLEKSLQVGNARALEQKNPRMPIRQGVVGLALLISGKKVYWLSRGDAKLLVKYKDNHDWVQINGEDLQTIPNQDEPVVSDSFVIPPDHLRQKDAQILNQTPQHILLASDWISSKRLLNLLNKMPEYNHLNMVKLLSNRVGNDNSSLLHLDMSKLVDPDTGKLLK